MKVFQLIGTHLRFLLVNQLQSREEKWYRANTIFILISRRTETATSAKGPRKQWTLAENALAQPYLEAEHFGDLITADHKVLSDNCESRNNHRDAVVVQDLATQLIQSYPCKTKTFSRNRKELTKVSLPSGKPKVIYIDNSLELGKSCEGLSWNPCTSTPPFRHKSDC